MRPITNEKDFVDYLNERRRELRNDPFIQRKKKKKKELSQVACAIAKGLLTLVIVLDSLKSKRNLK